MNPQPRIVRTGLAMFCCAATLAAQDLGHKAAPQKTPIAIRGASVHTMDRGILVGGTIWFRDGVIAGVGAADETADLPADTEVIDGRGLHVFPGLIAAHTGLGLMEQELVRQSVDVDELGEMTPEVVAAVAVNPDSTLLPVTRSNGVLAAAVFPRGGAVPGRVSVIQLDGWTNADLTVEAAAGLVVDWPAQQRGGEGRLRRPGRPEPAADNTRTEQRRNEITELFRSARAWHAASKSDANLPVDLRRQAMAETVTGNRPLFVLADEQEEIESAVRWAVGEGMRPVVVGGQQALACAALLREHDVPVILDGVHRLPRRADLPYSEPFELPAALARAEVRFCLASGQQFYNERNLPYAAATAVAFGLEAQRAMAAITRDAAQILGVGDRLGTLTTGKQATLIVTDGSPLEPTTKVVRAFIGGRAIDLANKQTALADKYREKYRQQSAGR